MNQVDKDTEMLILGLDKLYLLISLGLVKSGEKPSFTAVSISIPKLLEHGNLGRKWCVHPVLAGS